MKITPRQFIGRALGSIVCCVVFGIAGLITGICIGVCFPWWEAGTVKAPREET